MLILWPPDSWNGLSLPISDDHNLVFKTLNCDWSSGMFGMPFDFLFLEMGLSKYCWFDVSRLYIHILFSHLYDFVAFHTV